MKIATRKHWQIFLGFIIILLVINVILDTILGYFGYSPFDTLSRAINFLVTFPLYLLYPYLVGEDLNGLLKQQIKFTPTSNRLFLILVAMLMIPNFICYFYLDSLGDQPDVATWLTIILLVINFSLLFKISSFGARPMKSIELKRTAGFWEYGEESFQFLFWPLGLWWTQPIINRIVTKEIIIEE
jgi:hypothetical protein